MPFFIYDTYHVYVLLLILAALVIAYFAVFFSFGYRTLSLDAPPVPRRGMRIAVIVAHPDDEVLGAGGYIASAVEAGAQIKIIICTHGDGNRFDTDLTERTFTLTKRDFIEEGRLRARESLDAARILGVRGDDVIFLGFPDRGLTRLLKKNFEIPYTSPYTRARKTFYSECAFQDTPYTGKNLLNALLGILYGYKPDLVLTHHPKDVHRDHKAVYQFVLLALKDIVAAPTVLSFLIHWRIYQFPEPLRMIYHYPLDPPRALLNKYRWLAHPLDYYKERLKEDAIGAFRTQMRNPSIRLFLRAFIRTNELFCDAGAQIITKRGRKKKV